MITEDNVKQYWQERYNAQKEKTVGYSGNLEGYRERVKWVGEELGKLNLLGLRVLDYGCGTGMYSHIFDKRKYLGVDITKELLKHTPKGYRYIHRVAPFMGVKIFNAEMIYTNCVLQHNSDDLLRKILQGFKLQEPNYLVFYECIDPWIHNKHVKPRDYQVYDGFVTGAFGIDLVQKEQIKHTFKGEKHSLMIWERL